MKKIGIIGGLAWPSTIEYYRLLCVKTNAHFQARGAMPPLPTPRIVIESLDISQTRRLRGTQGDEASWKDYDDFFRETFVRLKRAGAEVGLIASNTPHTRLAGIDRNLPLAIVSIVDATAALVGGLGARRALILGTSLTMRSDIYRNALEKHDVEIIARPTDDEIAELEQLIDVDLYQGEITGARERIVRLCRAHTIPNSGDVVCLACTELPLAFPEHRQDAHFDIAGVRFVNTAVAHVEAVLMQAIAGPWLSPALR